MDTGSCFHGVMQQKGMKLTNDLPPPPYMVLNYLGTGIALPLYPSPLQQKEREKEKKSIRTYKWRVLFV